MHDTTVVWASFWNSIIISLFYWVVTSNFVHLFYCSILPVPRKESVLEVLDAILDKVLCYSFMKVSSFNYIQHVLFSIVHNSHNTWLFGFCSLQDEYNENDLDSSNQASFFCGSPPPRTSNPVVNDAQFMNQTRAVASPSGFYCDMKPSARIKRGSPTCGSSKDTNPKLTIEGFACRSPDSRGVVPPAFAWLSWKLSFTSCKKFWQPCFGPEISIASIPFTQHSFSQPVHTTKFL